MTITLRFGDRSASVEDMQRRLNCASPTRVPRLDPDGNFGFFTAARVREFQYRNHLEDDGVAGPATMRRINELPTTCTGATTAATRLILVNLNTNIGYVYHNGTRLRTLRNLLGGLESNEDRRSDRGVFQVYYCDEDHRSSQFGNAPMNYSVFYNRGEAFHQGSTRRASHGCIHLPATDAEWIFDWVLTGAVANGVARAEAERQCRRANVMVIVGP